MICPVCGCQQRKSASCVQCHAPLQEKAPKTSEQDLDLDLDLDLDPDIDTHPSSTKDSDNEFNEDTSPSQLKPVVEKPAPEKESAFKEKVPASVSVEKNPEKTGSVRKNGAGHILIATTQRVEGKRIGAYYGLVHAEALIASGENDSSTMNHLKKGVADTLTSLRDAAALLKANAVVATTFNYHRLDSTNILVSAVGTAVLLKTR